MRRHGRLSGYSLGEILIVLALIGMITAIVSPAWRALTNKLAVRAAEKEIRGVFHLARSRAIAQARNVGIRFRKEGADWTWAIYEDGDGDGVRNRDIDRKVDPLVLGPRNVLQESGSVRIALPSMRIASPDEDELLDPGDSPVRFNRSSLCSFAPNGAGTAGSIFLLAGETELYVVRVFGATGRIRTERYDAATDQWEDR